MSAECKNKYEVLKIIRDNVLNGLEAFKQPVMRGDNPPKDAWNCVEADQPSIQSMGRVVTLKLKSVKRVGYKTSCVKKSEDGAPSLFSRVETWMEEQEWEIKALISRKTEKVTAETMTAEDIAYQLAAWMNGPGVDEFRKNDCGNLFVQMKDIKLYQDKSDVPQNAASFPLKLHVPKQFVTNFPDAGVNCEGLIGV